MEALITLAIVGGIIYWAYRNGKHVGSQLGYGVGRRHGRRGRR